MAPKTLDLPERSERIELTAFLGLPPRGSRGSCADQHELWPVLEETAFETTDLNANLDEVNDPKNIVLGLAGTSSMHAACFFHHLVLAQT